MAFVYADDESGAEVYVIDREDTIASVKNLRFCGIKLFEITLITLAFTNMYLTYGINVINASIIIGIILSVELFFAIIISIVYALFNYCRCCKCCNSYFDKLRSFSYTEYITNTVCIWFSIQFISLFFVYTLLITTNHPYWIGPFEDIFYKFENNITVRPYFQTEQYSALFLEPETPTEISNIIINYGIKQNKTIRAIGSAHSSAPLFTNDVIISLNKFRHIELKLIKNGNNKNTIIIGAGWNVEDTEDYLYEHGFVLLGFGSSQAQTLPGMLGTGVYGAFGSMNKYLNAVWMIDGYGNDVYITKDDNYTLLSAIKVNIGLLGVIYRIEFEIEETFNVEIDVKNMLHKKFYDMSNEEFNDVMKINRNDENNDTNEYIGVKLFMYPWNYIIETFSKSDKYATLVDYNIDERLRGIINDIVYPISCLLPDCAEWAHEFETNIEVSGHEDRIYAAKSALRTIQPMYVGFMYAIPFEYCKDAMYDIQQLLNDYWPAVATVIPLLQSDDYGYLSYGYDTSVCMIEFYPKMCDGNRLKPAKEFEKRILSKYNGVEHWAKRYLFVNKSVNNTLHKFYSKYDEFQLIRKQFDPNNIFMNDYLGKYFEIDKYKDINISHELIDTYNKNAEGFYHSGWYGICMIFSISIIIAICIIFTKHPTVIMVYNPIYITLNKGIHFLETTADLKCIYCCENEIVIGPEYKYTLKWGFS
eukprot:293891_1